MRFDIPLLLFLLIFNIWLSVSQNSEFLTPFEKGGYNITPDYEQTIEFSKKLAEKSEFITYSTINQSARGEEIPLLIADKDGLSDPVKIRKKKRGILLIIACIHPGEPDGKDAGFLLFRDIACGRKDAVELLKNFSIVFIPIFNVDGHKRFGPYTRINQNGPEEAGWRTTAQNLNLNRDFLKAESPEMQNFLQFYHRWYPDFSIDCHTTNGADYQYVLTYSIETGPQTNDNVAAWTREKYLPFITAKMFEANYPVFPYLGFRNWHDPRGAIMHNPSPAIISNGYFAATNRPGLLIETHMLKPYRQRVEATYCMIKQTLIFLNENYSELANILANADLNMQNGKFAKEDFPVSVELSNDSVMIDFQGVHFEVDSSELSGGLWFRYFSDQPEIWKRAFFSVPEIKQSVKLPSAYIIPSEWSHLVQRMELHGVKYSLTKEEKAFRVKMSRFSDVQFEARTYEGCTRPSFTETRFDTTLVFPEGSYIIQTNQKAGRIIALLLEPGSMGSFVIWGYFNSIFEQKEYTEMYVMEEIARKMIADEPSLTEKFEADRKSNPEFYAVPWNVLNWYYRRSPWFDAQLNLYPVGRIFN